jgi:hypothetical protein
MELCGEFCVVVTNGECPLTPAVLPLEKELLCTPWIGICVGPFFDKDRILDRPVRGLDILPAAGFCEAEI